VPPAPPTDSHHDDRTPVIQTTGPPDLGISRPRVSPRSRPAAGKPPPRPRCLVGRVTHFPSEIGHRPYETWHCAGLRLDIPSAVREISICTRRPPAEAARYRRCCAQSGIGEMISTRRLDDGWSGP
jgi:hypothetical protein